MTKAILDTVHQNLQSGVQTMVADVFASLTEQHRGHFENEPRMLAALQRDKRFVVEARLSNREGRAAGSAQRKVSLRES